MELRPGYKQTEVGVIPEDWEVTSIGDLRPYVTSGSRGWARYYSEYGSPFIRITNLSRSSIYLELDDLRHVTLPSGDGEASRTELKDGDVLVSITADIGIIGHVTPRVPKPAYINQHIAVVRFPEFSTSGRYVSYYLASEMPQKGFRSLTDAGAKAGMNLLAVQQIRLALPPTLPEQRAIATALSDADSLIESLEDLIAKKRRIKQGAMQELLTGKRRLPGFSGAWEVKRLGEVAEPRKERCDPKQAGPHEFCIELEHIEQGTGRLIGSTGTSENSSLKSVFQKGDVLFGKLRAYLRKYWLATRDGVCSTEIWALVAKRPLLIPQYLNQVVMVDSFIEVASFSYGTHMPRSDWSVVKNYEIRIPSLPEQTAIATILSDMDTELDTLTAKLAKARQIKQGMMQELLTGRIRLA